MRPIVSLLIAGSIAAVAAVAIGPQPVAGSSLSIGPDCLPPAGSSGVAGRAYVPSTGIGMAGVGSDSARRDALPAADTATLVKDIYPGADRTWDRAPANLVAVGNRLFFTADDGRHGRELWASDGTSSGTYLVKDILPGSAGSGVGGLTAVGARLFFTANDGTHGSELWVTDGSKSGTRLVRDIDPGRHGSRHAGRPMVALGGRLYFAARDPEHGLELWRSDGTATGTRLVKDLVRGRASSRPSELTAYAGGLAFATQGKLWWTDGTSSGTRLIAGTEYLRGTFNYVGAPNALTAAGRYFFFRLDLVTGGGCVDVSETDLWRSDGTKNGTIKLRPDPTQMVAMGDSLAFFGPGDGGEIRMWLSDGTVAGTQPIRPALRPRSGTPVMALNGRLFWTERGGSFMATDGTGRTVVLKDHTGTSWNPSEERAAAVGNFVYFAAGSETDTEDGTDSNFQLWATDGTSAGTGLVATVNPDGDAYPAWLTAVGDRLFMVCTDPEYGRELWVYVP